MSLLPDMSVVAWRVVCLLYFGDGNFTVFCAVSGAFVGIVALTLVLTAVLFSLAGLLNACLPKRSMTSAWCQPLC